MPKKNKVKTISVLYYTLINEKSFNDGYVAMQDTVLRRILPNDGTSFTVETVDEIDKRIFWVEENEVELKEQKEERWTDEMIMQQEKEKNNTWINNSDN